MVATTGASADEIVADLIAMRIGGETFKDLLLRLDTEGTLNLQNLAKQMLGLAEATGVAVRELSALEVAQQRLRSLSSQQSIIETEILNRLAAGAPLGELPFLANQIGRQQSGGGIGTINNNFNGDVIGIDDLDNHIVRTVRDKALAGGFVGTPLVN